MDWKHSVVRGDEACDNDFATAGSYDSNIWRIQGGQEILQIRKDSDPISRTQSRQFVGKGYVVPANIRKMTQQQHCGSLPASYLQAPLHCLRVSHLPCNRHLRARVGLWLMRKVQAWREQISQQVSKRMTPKLAFPITLKAEPVCERVGKNPFTSWLKPIKSNLKPAMCTWRLYSPVMGTVARIPFSSVTAGAAMAQLRAAEKWCGSTCTSCERQWISSIPNALNIAPFFSSDSTYSLFWPSASHLRKQWSHESSNVAIRT